jgi:hypothetical protein
MVTREDVQRIATPTVGLHACDSVERTHGNSNRSRKWLQAARDEGLKHPDWRIQAPMKQCAVRMRDSLLAIPQTDRSGFMPISRSNFPASINPATVPITRVLSAYGMNSLAVTEVPHLGCDVARKLYFSAPGRVASTFRFQPSEELLSCPMLFSTFLALPET